METSYKEKYEQAIERLKQWDREHHYAGYVLSDRDKFIFPELAESEDERIRKALIKGFNECIEDAAKNYSPNMIKYWHGIEVDSILAWLEKQGGYSIKWNKNTEDNKPQVNHSILMQTTHGVAEGEWQGEKWFQYRWSSRLKDSSVLYWAELSDIENQGSNPPVLSNSANNGKDEQKTEENKGNIGGISSNWSEEDEKMFDFCCEYLDDTQEDWLKSLKDRVQQQPKYNFGNTELTQEELCEGLIRGMVDEHNRVTKEVLRNEYEKGRADAIAEMQKDWSIVDKDILFRIIDDLKFLRDTISIDPNYAVNFIDMEREITWLKSLRPQNKWKPSEEQLNNILDVLSFDNCTPKRRELLESLYEQLKKLKDG